MDNLESTILPYRDTKAVGAADFYFAINATFRFIFEKLGQEALRRYWTGLGVSYFAPVSAGWRAGGLPAVAEYWRDFFRAEPGAEVEVGQGKDEVVLTVKTCPAIAHLRRGRREIVPCFCQHCWFIGEAMAAKAGFTARVEGGNGSCRQVFWRADPSLPPQDLSKIREATC
ncbi:MAG: hypothetical protein ACOYMV_12975 [Verrucomicrobiia bacterium]